MSLRQDLMAQLRDLSQRSYLLAHATSMLLEADAREIARSLPESVNRLCTDDRPVPEDAIEMAPAEIRQRMTTLNQFMTDVLLVELQAVLHTHLMLADGHSLEKQAEQIEILLSRLWPKEARGTRIWAYREVILLTEIRNAVMHSRGDVAVPNQRLLDAGWTAEDLQAERRLHARSFSDFLRFKRAVRTIANEALPNGD